jgi:hypothetical protein
MQSIIKRFDRAPLEDRLLRANPAQPPRGKERTGPPGMATGAAPAPYGDRPPIDRGAMRDRRPPTGARRPTGTTGAPTTGGTTGAAPASGKPEREQRNKGGSQSAFAEELAKAL